MRQTYIVKGPNCRHMATVSLPFEGELMSLSQMTKVICFKHTVDTSILWPDVPTVVCLDLCHVTHHFLLDRGKWVNSRVIDAELCNVTCEHLEVRPSHR